MAAPVVVTVDGDCCCSGSGQPPTPCHGTLCACDVVGPFRLRLTRVQYAPGDFATCSPFDVTPGAAGCVFMPCDSSPPFSGTAPGGVIGPGTTLAHLSAGLVATGGTPCSIKLTANIMIDRPGCSGGGIFTPVSGGLSFESPNPLVLNSTDPDGCDVDAFLGTYDLPIGPVTYGDLSGNTYHTDAWILTFVFDRGAC